jgi:hypothetical protein
MKPARPHLGDSHNFGRRVEVCGERVAKPRTLLWEWLVLSADSPLRGFLEQASARDALGRDAFGFLPTLKFYSARRGLGGEVERVALTPLPAPSRLDKGALAAIVGRSLAFFSWLGVADLHWENLVLGLDARGKIIFGPLDVEMILADLSLPTETKLLPDAEPEYAAICQHACGVRRALPFLGKPVDPAHLLSMAAAYRGTLAFLERHTGSVAEIFTSLPGLKETPIRVCLRGTADYVRAQSEPLWPPLLEAEREQLERGDIPYFFRLYGRAGIHYYGDRSLKKLKRIPLTGDVPQLDPILKLSNRLRSPKRRKLREDGLFSVLGAFDHPSLAGAYQSDELEVRFGQRSLAVKMPDGQEFRSPRNLSAFVSSVYLPCLCGEVRSVFVPQVTVCKPDPRAAL